MNGKNYSRNKPAGIALMIIAVFAAMVIFHRMGCYLYEYDPQFAPYDYGRFNFFSFFTVQSNIFVCIYLFIISLSYLGIKSADKAAYNPVLTVLVTTYIIITGAVYCAGIPLGFTPPFVWKDPVHSMSSFIQIFHHMIIPPLMIILLIFRKNSAKFKYKYLPFTGIYPFVYSVFSIIRGAVSDPPFYAYPFYNPEFVYGLFFKSGEAGLKGYFLMIPLLILGISLFILTSAAVAVIYNKKAVEK